MSAYVLSPSSIASLAKTIVATCSGTKVPFFAEDVIDAMIAYDWMKDRNPVDSETGSPTGQRVYKITEKNYHMYLANYMMELNVDSVDGRYSKESVPELVDPKEGVMLSVDNLYVGLKSFLYQSSEGELDRTYLYVVLDMFKKAVKRNFTIDEDKGTWL